MDLIYQIVIIAVSAISTGFGGWFFGRRHQNAETVSLETSNMKEVAEMWEKTARSFEGLYTSSQQENTRLMAEMGDIRRDYYDIKNRFEEMRAQNENLAETVAVHLGKLDKIESENQQLKKELNQLKKQRNDADK